MILPLKRYAQFSGRSPRREYWMFVLFNIIVSIVLGIVDTVLGLGGHTSSYSRAAPAPMRRAQARPAAFSPESGRSPY
ncbi:DUF805 domain-containing protein [Sphingomonas oryzagri]